MELFATPRPQPSRPRDRHAYYADCAEVPGEVAVNTRRRSFSVAAGVQIDSPEAEGVLFAHGGVGGGHALFVRDPRLDYVNSWIGEFEQKVSSYRDVVPGKYALAGDGLAVGRDTGSSVSRDYGPGNGFPFSGGVIERVVFDVSGDAFVDHDEEVQRWLLRDRRLQQPATLGCDVASAGRTPASCCRLRPAGSYAGGGPGSEVG